MEKILEFSIPQQRELKYGVFPLGLTTNGNFLENWLLNNQEELDNQLRNHKGILFRNCGVKDVRDFDAIIEATGLSGMDYIGGAAVRTQLSKRVFTANESPSSEKIPFHHEMAQTPNPPTHLFFFCERPPDIGGEVSFPIDFT
jgi:hypothetical protein